MRVFITLFLTLGLLLAENIVQLKDVSVYNRSSRIDIVLSFDKPYEHLLRQSQEDGKLVFTLDGLSLKLPFSKDLDSNLASNVAVVSAKDTTKIIISPKQKLEVDAKMDQDKLALRLRLIDPSFMQESFKDFTKDLSKSVNKADDFSYKNYVLILIALMALLILLWVLKYYFKSKLKDKDFEIKFQRPLDRQNKFMIIEHKKQIYTMIIGSSNLLLEVENSDFKARKSSNMVYADYSKEEDEDFSQHFDENKAKLEKLAKELRE